MNGGQGFRQSPRPILSFYQPQPPPLWLSWKNTANCKQAARQKPTSHSLPSVSFAPLFHGPSAPANHSGGRGKTGSHERSCASLGDGSTGFRKPAITSVPTWKQTVPALEGLPGKGPKPLSALRHENALQAAFRIALFTCGLSLPSCDKQNRAAKVLSWRFRPPALSSSVDCTMTVLPIAIV